MRATAFLFLTLLIQANTSISQKQATILKGKLIDEYGKPVTGNIFIDTTFSRSMMIVPQGSEGPSEKMMEARPVRKIATENSGDFSLEMDGSIPNYLYFQSPGKRFFTVCFPQTTLKTVTITATMYNYSSVRDESNGFITSTDNEVNEWLEVFFYTNPFLNNEIGRFANERSAWIREKGSYEGFTGSLQNYYQTLLSKYSKTKIERLKEYIALNLAYLKSTGFHDVDEKLLRKTVTSIPSSDYLWLYNTRFIPDVYKSLGGLTKNRELLTHWMDSLVEYCPKKSVIPLFLFSAVSDAYTSKQPEFNKYFDLLVSNFPQSPSARNAMREFGAHVKIKSGAELPDFSVINTKSIKERIEKNTLNGKILLIDFWATWCGPCIKAFPELEKVYAKYKEKGFEIISISVDEDIESIKQFFQKRKPLPWLSGFMGNGKTAASIFEVHALPKLILVDKNGKIISAHRGELEGANLEMLVEQAISGSSGKGK